MQKVTDSPRAGQSSAPPLHPLSPLSEAEIAAACAILKEKQKLGPDTRFAFVQLEEPAKAQVLAWQPGHKPQRRAAATVFDCRSGATHLAVVDIASSPQVEVDQVRIGVVEQGLLGLKAKRNRQTTTERLNESPMRVRLPERLQVRNLPTLSAGPFEGRFRDVTGLDRGDRHSCEGV